MRKNESIEMLLRLGMIILMALCPPLGVIIVLCIALSGKTVSGFITALSVFAFILIMALIASPFL